MTQQATSMEEIERQIEAGELSADDPKVLDLISKLSGAEDAPAAGDESETRADPADEAGKAADPAGNEEKGEKAILSKDGKHLIPYDVLETERNEKEAAVAAAKQLAAVTQALEKQLSDMQAANAAAAGGEGKPAPAQAPNLRAKLDEAKAAVEELAKEYPDLAPAQRSLLESMATMAEQVYGELGRQQQITEQLRRFASENVNEKHAKATESAKDALAQVPALVVWQTKNPDLFKLAAKFDDQLKVDPDWKGKTMAERFSKAVELVAAMKGPAVLNGIAPVQDAKGKAKTPGNAADAIAAALGISTLSDLPGGSAVSQTPGALDAMSESQLIEKLAGIRDDSDLLHFIADSVS